MATIRNLLIRISVSENTNAGIRKVTASLSATNREIDRADTSSNRFTGTLSKLGKTSFGTLTGGLAKVAAVTKTAAVGLFAVASAAAALNTVTQAGVALAPLLGGLLLIPGAALAGATALGTLKLATNGVSDAFKAAMGSDPKKFAKALQDLSPAARSVALEMHRLRPELLSIQQTAQQNLFAPLRGQLTALAKVLTGPVKQGIADIAIQFGVAGRNVAQFARQSESVAVLQKAFATTAGSIRLLQPALLPVLTGFRGLASVGLSFLPPLVKSVSDLAQRFGAWLQQIVATGQAATWISNALATLRQLLGVVAQVGGILKSVFSAASAAGSNFIGVIGAALSQLNAFLKTAAGQSALRSIFQALASIGQTLGPVIGAVVTQLGALAPPIANLAKMIGPILTAAVNALGPALGTLGAGLAGIFGGLSSAITAIGPALPALGRALSTIGLALGQALSDPAFQKGLVALGSAFGALLSAAAPLLPIIANLAGTLVSALAPIVPPLAIAIATFATALGTQLGRVIQAIGPTLPALAVALGQVLLALTPLLKPLADILIAVTPLIPVLAALINFLAPLAPYIAAWTAAQWLLNLALDANPIGLLIVALAALVLGIVYAWKHCQTFRIIVEGAMRGIVAALSWIGHAAVQVVKWFASMVSGVYHAWLTLTGYVTSIPGRIFSVFSGAGRWLYNAGRNIIIGLWNGIAGLGSWLYNKLVSLVKAIIPGPVKWALGISSPSKVMAELGRFAGMGLAVGIDASRGPVSAAATRLAGAAVPAMSGFVAPAGVAGAAGAAAATQAAAAAGSINPKTLAQAIKQALHGTTVEMDSKPVGQIVSRDLGQTTSLRRKTG